MNEEILINDNGNHPIHPFKNDFGDDSSVTYFGLTKREYFAGLAMAELTHYIKLSFEDANGNLGFTNLDMISQMSVAVADSLLKKLEK